MYAGFRLYHTTPHTITCADDICRTWIILIISVGPNFTTRRKQNTSALECSGGMPSRFKSYYFRDIILTWYSHNINIICIYYANYNIMDAVLGYTCHCRAALFRARDHFCKSDFHKCSKRVCTFSLYGL